MSVVFSRDIDEFDFRPIHSFSVGANLDNNKEGYCGEPTSFKDVNGAEFKEIQKRYELECSENFRKNKDLVRELIRLGNVYPTCDNINDIINKLKEIAKNG